jgi:LysM repeat protein
MKLFLAICLFSLFISLPHSGFSQKEVEISGVKYVLHSVKKSETVFSLCQKYKVTQKEILQANPGLAAVLQTGSMVKIPIKKAEVNEPVKTEVAKPAQIDTELYYHKVAKKQTIFSIAKQYGLTPNELIRFNPELTNGLIIGQVLKIPVKITSEAPVEPVAVQQPPTTKYKVEKGETLFSLAARFGVEVTELKNANPSLFSRSLEAGETILIPAKSELKAKVPEVQNPVASQVEEPVRSVNCSPVSGKNNQKYKAGLLLPFFCQETTQ